MITVFLAAIAILIAAFKILKKVINNNPENFKVMSIERYEEFIGPGKTKVKLNATFNNWATETQQLILKEAPHSQALSVHALREFYNKCFLPVEVLAEVKSTSVQVSKAA